MEVQMVQATWVLSVSNDDINSFQNGVDKIYNKCKSLGSTPSTKTPDSIIKSIQSIYNTAKTSGIDNFYFYFSSSSITHFPTKSRITPSSCKGITTVNNQTFTVAKDGTYTASGSGGKGGSTVYLYICINNQYTQLHILPYYDQITNFSKSISLKKGDIVSIETQNTESSGYGYCALTITIQ